MKKGQSPEIAELTLADSKESTTEKRMRRAAIELRRILVAVPPDFILLAVLLCVAVGGWV